MFGQSGIHPGSFWMTFFPSPTTHPSPHPPQPPTTPRPQIEVLFGTFKVECWIQGWNLEMLKNKNVVMLRSCIVRGISQGWNFEILTIFQGWHLEMLKQFQGSRVEMLTTFQGWNDDTISRLKCWNVDNNSRLKCWNCHALQSWYFKLVFLRFKFKMEIGVENQKLNVVSFIGGLHPPTHPL